MTRTVAFEPENISASPAAPPDGEHYSISPIPATHELIFVQRGWLPPEQEYYWTEEWQTEEREAREEYAAGRGVRFDTAEDAIRWLLSADD